MGYLKIILYGGNQFYSFYGFYFIFWKLDWHAYIQ